ncbi:hypothetical protein GCM10022293_44200 [Azospirillum formosense]
MNLVALLIRNCASVERLTVSTGPEAGGSADGEAAATGPCPETLPNAAKEGLGLWDAAGGMVMAAQVPAMNYPG